MKEVTLYFDGGIRNGIMAVGFVIDDMNGEEIFSRGHLCGNDGSSNISEYRALISGLQSSLKLGVDIIHIIGDSQLIIKQVIGAFRTKKPELKKHKNYILELLTHFERHTIKWVPRRENKRADALVNTVFEKRKNKKCSKRKRK